MAKELVRPRLSKLSDDVVATCEMIDAYFVDNNVNEFSVSVSPCGNVSVVTEDPAGTEFVFTI